MSFRINTLTTGKSLREIMSERIEERQMKELGEKSTAKTLRLMEFSVSKLLTPFEEEQSKFTALAKATGHTMDYLMTIYEVLKHGLMCPACYYMARIDLDSMLQERGVNNA